MKCLQIYFFLLFSLSGAHFFAQAPVCFQFALSSAEANLNDTVRLRVSSRGFEDISAFQFVLSWDTAQLQFHKMVKQAPTFNNLLYNVNLVKEGHLLTLWDDLTTLGVTMPNDSSLMELWFIVRTDSTGFIPILMESEQFLTLIYGVWNHDGDGFPYIYKVGGVHANGASAPPDLPLDVCMTTLSCQAAATAWASAQQPAQFEWRGESGLLGTGDSLAGITAELIHLHAFDAVSSAKSEYFLKAQKEQAAISIAVDSLRHPYCRQANGYIALDLDPQFGPYTIKWSDLGDGPSARGDLIAGTYRVTVTSANGCAGYRNFYLVNREMTISLDSVNADCRSKLLGSVSASVDNGVPPYQYKWSVPGQTGFEIDSLLPGRYTLTVTDATGCSLIKQTSVLDYGTFDWNLNLFLHCNPGNLPYENAVFLRTDASLKNRATFPLQVFWNRGTIDIIDTLTSDVLSMLHDVPHGLYRVTVVDSEGCRKEAPKTAILDCEEEDLFADASTNGYFEVSSFTPNSSQFTYVRILYRDLLNVKEYQFGLKWDSNKMRLVDSFRVSTYDKPFYTVKTDTVNGLIEIKWSGDYLLQGSGSLSFYLPIMAIGNDLHPELKFTDGFGGAEMVRSNGLKLGFAGRSGRVHFEDENDEGNAFNTILHQAPDCVRNGYGRILVRHDEYDQGFPKYIRAYFNGDFLDDPEDILTAEPGAYDIYYEDMDFESHVFVRIPDYGNVFNECVWPGDVDHDGVVNQYDPMFFDEGIFNYCAARFTPTIEWVGQENVPACGGSFVNGFFLQAFHSDTDGNGSITVSDTLAIAQNWGKRAFGAPFQENNVPLIPAEKTGQMKCYLEIDSLADNHPMLIPVYLEQLDTSLQQNQYLNGYAFSLSFDTSLFLEYPRFTPVSLNGNQKSYTVRALQKVLPGERRLDVGAYVDEVITDMTVDKVLLGFIEGVPGYLPVGKRVSSYLTLSNAYVHMHSKLYALETQSKPVMFVGASALSSETAVPSEKNEGIRLYPNPASESVSFYSPKQKMERIQCFDMQGRTVFDVMPGGQQRYTWSVGALSNGVYWVQVRTDAGTETQKLVIQR